MAKELADRVFKMDGSRRNVGPTDFLIVVGFFCFSLWYFAQIIQGGPPYLVRSGDGANILSFVIARLHPENFAKDALLHDTGNFAFYRTFVTAWTAIIGRWAGGDFALAYLALAIPCVFLHLSGFFLLFRLVGLGAVAAVIGSVTMLATVPSAAGTYWGGFTDPQPRFLFQSLLPFLLAGAWQWRNRPARWRLLFLALGLATYVHPVSGPAVAFAIWCALSAVGFAETDWRGRTGRLIAMGFLYLLVIAPFAYLYTSVGENARGSGVSTDLVLSIAEQRFAPGYLDLPRLLADAMATTWLGIRGAFALGAVLVAVWLWQRRDEDRQFVRLLFGFFVGLLIVGILVPLLDHLVAAWMNRYPAQVDLVRNIRYFIPAVLIVVFVGSCRFLATRKPWAAPVIAALLSVIWLAANPIARGIGAGSPIGSVLESARCVVTARYCRDLAADRRHYRELVGFLRQNTAPGESLFATNGDHALRYAARRSLVFSDKDGGALAYANHAALLQWYRTFESDRAVAGRSDPKQRLQGWLQMARELGADYIVSDQPLDPDWPLDRTRVLFTNARYTVLSVPGPEGTAPTAD